MSDDETDSDSDRMFRNDMLGEAMTNRVPIDELSFSSSDSDSSSGGQAAAPLAAAAAATGVKKRKYSNGRREATAAESKRLRGAENAATAALERNPQSAANRIARQDGAAAAAAAAAEHKKTAEDAARALAVQKAVQEEAERVAQAAAAAAAERLAKQAVVEQALRDMQVVLDAVEPADISAAARQQLFGIAGSAVRQGCGSCASPSGDGGGGACEAQLDSLLQLVNLCLEPLATLAAGASGGAVVGSGEVGERTAKLTALLCSVAGLCREFAGLAVGAPSNAPVLQAAWAALRALGGLQPAAWPAGASAGESADAGVSNPYSSSQQSQGAETAAAGGGDRELLDFLCQLFGDRGFASAEETAQELKDLPEHQRLLESLALHFSKGAVYGALLQKTELEVRDLANQAMVMVCLNGQISASLFGASYRIAPPARPPAPPPDCAHAAGGGVDLLEDASVRANQTEDGLGHELAPVVQGGQQNIRQADPEDSQDDEREDLRGDQPGLPVGQL